MTDAHAEVVARLPGAWVGVADSPVGEIPFAVAFERTADGAIHGRAEQSPDMYLDFRFHADGERWLFTEEGAFPGLAVQRYTLQPVAGAIARWTVAEKPGYLDVDVAVDGDALTLVARVRGEEHAALRLRRAPAAAVSSR